MQYNNTIAADEGAVSGGAALPHPARVTSIKAAVIDIHASGSSTPLPHALRIVIHADIAGHRGVPIGRPCPTFFLDASQRRLEGTLGLRPPARFIIEANRRRRSSWTRSRMASVHRVADCRSKSATRIDRLVHPLDSDFFVHRRMTATVGASVQGRP